ncbi:GTP 3',8-cyclase MoaA [Actinomyces denticolens]|uniref:GTP 3',8-cyclase MoaA n=1 Tax=Actinomyces denticolens TaxID=52767 RepID=UPI0009360FA0|nr:GTP 3',8-cyclase MoaA [Actinomyces denticolens]
MIPAPALAPGIGNDRTPLPMPRRRAPEGPGGAGPEADAGAGAGPVAGGPGTAALPWPGPTPSRLIDRYGRTVRDLRLSITDRCNLRCSYCMPAQGLDWLDSPLLLTADEIGRLARIAITRLGVERIRITGGEPLMRRDLEEIISAIAALRTPDGAVPDIGLTTNGLGLDKRAAALRDAGLARVNVSIDALDREAYAALTRRDRLDDALAGAAAAQAAGLAPIKVNAVALPGTLNAQAPRLLAECLRRGWQLRFIEHMPLGPRESWSGADVVGAERILAALTGAGFALEEAGRPDRRPAALWRVAAGEHDGAAHPAGSVGIIASVTAPFCADCDRARITADGRLMNCLFSTTETDLRAPLRSGATDEDIMRLWAAAAWRKPLAHGSDDPGALPSGFARPGRTMSAIGG